ncbi:DASH complex, subunit Dad1 [Penicillium italicum]|uniref:DASH complex subunit DAD1 n=1 Tax=Penicillium italicum TaxID=40296 RepID=A0A0A2L5V6_PENIT|nr:DASH complex, subunit Dad1 [Penicillium italicum]
MAWLQQTPGSGGRVASPTVFEQQREELVREIAVGMEEVLQNMNRLNRNLESVIAVGNEFGSVEALWSQFENFMGRPEEQGEEAGNGNGKRKVSGESDAAKSGVKRENDEGDSTLMQ